MGSADGSLCGTKSAGKAHLLRHVDQDHGLKGERPVFGRKRITGKREACSESKFATWDMFMTDIRRFLQGIDDR